MSPKARDAVIILFAVALVTWGSGMLFAFLVGLFNPLVDNDKIFGIIGPIASQVSSAAISIVSTAFGIKIGEARERSRNIKPKGKTKP